jgi:actin related protein 2/3 complex, subunit 3
VDQLRQVCILAPTHVSTTLTHNSHQADPEQGDIIDETIDLFRANSLFRNFEIKGPADRLLIILILFISDCLAKIGSAKTVPSQIEAGKLLNTLSVDNFPIPGDANFPLNAHYAPPGSRADAGTSHLYSPTLSLEPHGMVNL